MKKEELRVGMVVRVTDEFDKDGYHCWDLIVEITHVDPPELDRWGVGKSYLGYCTYPENGSRYYNSFQDEPSTGFNLNFFEPTAKVDVHIATQKDYDEIESKLILLKLEGVI